MAKLTNPFRLPERLKRWLPAGAFGLVVLAGVLLPQLMSDAAAVPEAPPTREPAPKDNWAYTPPTFPEGPDAKAMLTRLALGTVLVLGLCAGSLWVGKRFLHLKGVPAGENRQLRVVETLRLNHRCCVFLLQAGNRQVLAGVDASGLKALVPWSDSFEETLTEAQGGETPLPGALTVMAGSAVPMSLRP